MTIIQPVIAASDNGKTGMILFQSHRATDLAYDVSTQSGTQSSSYIGGNGRWTDEHDLYSISYAASTSKCAFINDSGIIAGYYPGKYLDTDQGSIAYTQRVYITDAVAKASVESVINDAVWIKAINCDLPDVDISVNALNIKLIPNGTVQWYDSGGNAYNISGKINLKTGKVALTSWKAASTAVLVDDASKITSVDMLIQIKSGMSGLYEMSLIE